MTDVRDHHADATATTPVVVYWRPGCGFCSGLLRSLERYDLDHERRNIWEDEDAAAFVRSVTGGSETVPTVVVGNRALVNPSARDVMSTVAEVAPEQLPEGFEPPAPGRVGNLLNRLLGA